MPRTYKEAMELGEIHRAVFDTDHENWELIQCIHNGILKNFLHTDDSVVDIGCGCGLLLDCLDDMKVEYTGVDVDEEAIKTANVYFRGSTFLQVESYASLPFDDHQFSIAVLRSLEGTIQEQQGIVAWRRIMAEAMRVSKRVILLNYSASKLYRVVEVEEPPEYLSTIRHEHGRLVYRQGMDNSWEIYDLFVEDEHRKKGIGRQLIKELAETVDPPGSMFGFTRIENRGAQTFYRKLGFMLVEIPLFYRGFPAIFFVKKV